MQAQDNGPYHSLFAVMEKESYVIRRIFVTEYGLNSGAYSFTPK